MPRVWMNRATCCGSGWVPSAWAMLAVRVLGRAHPLILQTLKHQDLFPRVHTHTHL